MKYLFFLTILILGLQAFSQTITSRNDNNRDTKAIDLLRKAEKVLYSETESAIEMAQEAYELLKRGANEELWIRACNTLGTAYSIEGNQKRALKLFYFGLEYANSQNDHTLLVKFNSNVGNCYGALGDYASAIEFYESALTFAKKLKEEQQIAHCENNIGFTYYMLESYDEALIHFRLALKINEKFDNKQALLHYSYGNLGNTYLKLGDYVLAKNYFERHAQLAMKLEDESRIIWSNQFFAELYLAKNEFSVALNHCNKVISKAHEIQFKRILSDAYNTRSLVFKGMGKYEEAYDDVVESKRYPIANYVIDASDIIEEIRIQNKYKEQKKTLQLEKENNSLLEKKNRFNILFFIMLLVTLGLIVVILIVNYRNKIKAHELQQKVLNQENETVVLKNKTIELELQKKQDELSYIMAFLTKTNDLILMVSEKLETFRAKNRGDMEIIDSVIKTIKLNLKNSMWKEFEERFNKIHSEFYYKIQKDFKLTPNERRLCAFLRLNMSSKDISSITGQSIHSIEVARTRLRKKIGLSNTSTNLVDFLSTY